MSGLLKLESRAQFRSHNPQPAAGANSTANPGATGRRPGWSAPKVVGARSGTFAHETPRQTKHIQRTTSGKTTNSCTACLAFRHCPGYRPPGYRPP
eukprot:5371591-Prymnesium_polylepis.1